MERVGDIHKIKNLGIDDEASMGITANGRVVTSLSPASPTESL
jgi:hypothetical protein